MLRALLAAHPELAGEAEGLARAMVAATSEADVAVAIESAVGAADSDAVYARAGQHAWGYVDPSEAAETLLEESIEDVVADMKRLVESGMDDGAAATCLGIVTGLFNARDAGGGTALEWAPDFPGDSACSAVEDLLRCYPQARRREIGDRLLPQLGDRAPSWAGAFRRAIDRAVRRR